MWQRFVFVCVLLALAVCTANSQAQRPEVSFGVMADIQYADKNPAGARHYRESIAKAQACAAALGSQKLDFAIQLGDLADEGLDNLDTILRVVNRMHPAPRHVLGNHDLCARRDVVLKRLGLPSAYYNFSVDKWRFIVLDGMQISVGKGWAESSANYQAGARMLAELKEKRATNAAGWNGAVGDKQRAWLQAQLVRAANNRERAIIFCHFPVLAESCRPEHLLWDNREVLALLDSAPALVAWMNGHDHRGGYAAKNGIHYVTFPGMVESDIERACNVVELYHDRLQIGYPGKPASRVLPIR